MKFRLQVEKVTLMHETLEVVMYWVRLYRGLGKDASIWIPGQPMEAIPFEAVAVPNPWEVK
jgi:hypothetical protein